MAYDIIGDIHGQSDKLVGCLEMLGYRRWKGAYRCNGRQAIFVGDLIDRGSGQLETLQLVREMAEVEAARVVMGNHELNAIGWATPTTSGEGRFMRARHGDRGLQNRKQHEAFLAEVGEDTPVHREWVSWFSSLPLFIEQEGLRVVHACWHGAVSERLRAFLDEKNALRAEALPAALVKGNPVGDAVDVLLKGPEVRLPPGVSFADKDGHERHEIRIRWWDPTIKTFADAYMGPPGVDIPPLPLPEIDKVPETDRPTFIGHYWLDPNTKPASLSRLVACVDYSVAKGGPLVAYRFDYESEIDSAKFHVC